MHLSRLERAVVFNSNGRRCVYCNRQIGWKLPQADQVFTVDHAVSFNRGDKHALSNWRPACHACNELKSDRTEAEFLAVPTDLRSRCESSSPLRFVVMGPVDGLLSRLKNGATS